MRINHNIAAMVTQGSLFTVNRDLGKSIQKLSTGLRINAAGDDAAGLGVSENLRKQVRGMGQASKNAQDAISLLNVADGALGEQSTILQRMRELVIQAKNDTYTSTERGYMGREFSALKDELDRIAAVTNFNGMRIFANPDADGEVGIYSSTFRGGPPHRTQFSNDVFTNANDSVFGAADTSSSTHFNMMIGANYTATDAAATISNREAWNPNAENMITIQFGQMNARGILSKNPGAIETIDPDHIVDDFSWDPTNDIGDMVIDVMTGVGTATAKNKLDLYLDLIDGGENVDPLLNTALYNGDQNITGLERISTMRAKIGAMVNRLEHTVTNLQNSINNTQAAESVIRDADFAQESATFTRNQILTQSATSMLSQANMVSQGVLSLLQR